MFNLKGFIRINSITNNVVGQVSPLGELSSLGLTYRREKGYYTVNAVDGIELVSFTNMLEEPSVTPVAIVVPSDVAAFTLDVANWAYIKSTDDFLFNEVNGSYPDYINEFIIHFTASPYLTNAFANFSIGNMITIGTGPSEKKMPEWASWTMNYHVGPTAKQATIKIWFADESFRTQYDEYEIFVIPPIKNYGENVIPPAHVLNDLYTGTFSQVKAIIDAFTIPELMESLDRVKSIYPCTLEKTTMYNWSDGLVPDPNLIPTPWTVVIYGMAGNNADIIINAIRNFILASVPTHTYNQWAVRFPDIFKTTEFIITPMWNRYSIPNEELIPGLHSPTVNFNQDIVNVLPTFLHYPEPHIRLHTMSSAFMYRSLAFYVVGSPDNRDNEFDFTDVFPDYFLTSTNGDFAKMSLKTQAWVLFITDMLLIAQNMTEFSSVPFQYSRVFRGTGPNRVMYVAGTLDSIQYLITSQDYFTDNVPPPEDL